MKRNSFLKSLALLVTTPKTIMSITNDSGVKEILPQQKAMEKMNERVPKNIKVTVYGINY